MNLTDLRSVSNSFPCSFLSLRWAHLVKVNQLRVCRTSLTYCSSKHISTHSKWTHHWSFYVHTVNERLTIQMCLSTTLSWERLHFYKVTNNKISHSFFRLNPSIRSGSGLRWTRSVGAPGRKKVEQYGGRYLVVQVVSDWMLRLSRNEEVSRNHTSTWRGQEERVNPLLTVPPLIRRSRLRTVVVFTI